MMMITMMMMMMISLNGSLAITALRSLRKRGSPGTEYRHASIYNILR
jgi:hypothetical protein